MISWHRRNGAKDLQTPATRCPSERHATPAPDSVNQIEIQVCDVHMNIDTKKKNKPPGVVVCERGAAEVGRDRQASDPAVVYCCGIVVVVVEVVGRKDAVGGVDP
jgi:hypothetical protein